jgi:hypothetical protein
MGDGSWRLAPETGERLLRDMVRATALTGGTTAKDLDAAAHLHPTPLAGNLLSPTLYAGLANAVLPDIASRTVRLEGDAVPADVLLTGDRLWRAAEPGDDPCLANASIEDIADWVAACAA